MKHLIAIVTMAISAAVFAASPAATQAWVIDYVAKHSGGGGSGGGGGDYSTNTVNGIINNIKLSTALLSIGATNAAYRITTAPTTNEKYRVLAPIAASVWTNAPAHVSLSTNATKAVYRSYDGTVYESTNYTASVIEFYANATTNRPSVVVLSYSATDAEIIEARGE